MFKVALKAFVNTIILAIRLLIYGVLRLLGKLSMIGGLVGIIFAVIALINWLTGAEGGGFNFIFYSALLIGFMVVMGAINGVMSYFWSDLYKDLK